MKTHLIDWRPAKTRTVLFRIIPTKDILNYYYAIESDHGILQIIMLWMKYFRATIVVAST